MSLHKQPVHLTRAPSAIAEPLVKIVCNNAFPHKNDQKARRPAKLTMVVAWLSGKALQLIDVGPG